MTQDSSPESGRKTDSDAELKQIRERYQRRQDESIQARYPLFSPFQHYSASEREYWFSERITQAFERPKELRVLDVGAGTGFNLGYFRRLGIPVSQIWAAELLEERARELLDWLPTEQIRLGDASRLEFEQPFDVIFQATVFSSILDTGLRQRLAAKMWELLKPGGLILWYDFTFDNPWNKDVRGVRWAEVKSLFPQASSHWHKRITLLPPLGRRVGRLYPYVNFWFLRSHLVATLHKKR